MKRGLPTILDTLHSLALAFWLGGILMIGAAVAPAAFHRVSGLTRLQSASVVGESLRLFGGYVAICGLVMVGAQYLLRRRYQRDRARYIGDGMRQLLTFAALLLAETCQYSLFPLLDKARGAGHDAEFNRLHGMYTSLSMVQVALLIAVAALTAWLQQPRPVTVPLPPAPPPPAPGPVPKSKPRPTARRAAK